MPFHLMGQQLIPAAAPHLPAGLWAKAVRLLGACILAACLAQALAPFIPGRVAWGLAGLAAVLYMAALIGCAWQPGQATRWAFLAAFHEGAFLGFSAAALSPYLPGIAIPALAAELAAFTALWACHFADRPQTSRLKVTASALAAQALVYLLALVLSHYFGLDYLRLSLAGTGLAGLLINMGISALLAAQVERQAQLLAALPPQLSDGFTWRAALGLLACLAGYCGNGMAGRPVDE